MNTIERLREAIPNAKFWGRNKVVVSLAEARTIITHIDTLAAEHAEQSRLLGMSAEREAALLAKLAAAERERDAAETKAWVSARRRGADTERAAVVAWLRAEAADYNRFGNDYLVEKYEEIADAIEAGRHRGNEQ